MRALVGMLLLTLGGCDTLWASYIAMGDFVLDGGAQCSAGSCDAGPSDGPTPDLQVTGCTNSSMCAQPNQYCEVNTGLCTAIPPSIEAFPSGVPFETIITLNKHYVLMATGDYNGDGFTDIVVSGLFTGPPNATGASATGLETYLGDGAGNFNLDKQCDIPNNDAPVYLLTVPTSNKLYSGVLVATYGSRLYYCSRSMGGNSWTTAMVGNNGVPTGFKQLALANNEGQATPDILIRTSKFLYLETQDPSLEGSLDVRRTNARYVLSNQSPSQASSSGIVWATPLRFAGATGDTLALTWDDPVDMQKRGLDLYYTDALFATTRLNFSPGVYMMGGSYFPELRKPLRTTALLHSSGKDPLLLVAVSQQPNYLGVLTGTAASALTLQSGPTSWNQPGLMLSYTGDADDDGLDEIGLYSMALNTNQLTRRLQILSYKKAVIDVASPILDIAYTAENVRGMSFEYLGAIGDRRRSYRRKDLIALIENPTGNAQLVIRRANLNYQFP